MLVLEFIFRALPHIFPAKSIQPLQKIARTPMSSTSGRCMYFNTSTTLSVFSETMETTRSRHSWMHMFITHCLTLTLQLHNFHLSRTCRTSSFCSVAWQLARFQLTQRIARSLGDTWASHYSCWTPCCCSARWPPQSIYCIIPVFRAHIPNPPQRHAVVNMGQTDGQTDTVPLHRSRRILCSVNNEI